MTRDHWIGSKTTQGELLVCGLIGGEGTCPLRQGGCHLLTPQASQFHSTLTVLSLKASLTSDLNVFLLCPSSIATVLMVWYPHQHHLGT